uniref:Uncharacterized protein n=1 Tax=Tanacetum cinerariifolium TaxID=118510 RepID=A0A6L2N0K9_TANCI|nr:hypothetical protein [Tanacetum cinerariifolium]
MKYNISLGLPTVVIVASHPNLVSCNISKSMHSLKDNAKHALIYLDKRAKQEKGLESYQQKVNLIAPTITFLGINKKKLLTITSEPVVGLIYENNKKEKRVMKIDKIPKFCDATLTKALRLIRKKNLDIKHGYDNPKVSDNDVEYIRLCEEDIKGQLWHRHQMTRWEMYANGRPIRSRSGRPE